MSNHNPDFPKVFISYSHDSREHIDRVKNLCIRLYEDGIDCTIDQCETSPPEGWPAWMEKQIGDADFVLILCSEAYKRRWDGKETFNKGYGVRWEGHIIRQHLYNAGTLNTKFIPILLESGKFEHIPTPLQGSTYYFVDVDENYENLRRHLTHQLAFKKRELGERRNFPPLENQGDFLEGTGLLQDFKEVSPSEFKGNYYHQKIIEYRHLTGINEYPTLSFLETILPKKLTTILGINTTPIIYINNPVIESLERFRRETGNEKLISLKYHFYNDLDISYTTHQAGLTKEGVEYCSGESRKSDFTQNLSDFEKDTVKFDGEGQEFEYAPILIPFQASLENADWTAVCTHENRSGGSLFQYPKLSDVELFGIKDDFTYSNVKDKWINKVIKNNPELRGFLLYEYQYLDNLSEHFGFCGISDLSKRLAPTLYIRFIDIKNATKNSITLESIDSKVINNNDYQLTNMDSRSLLFSKIEPKNQQIKILIVPGDHLLIPIEFGFDTKNHYKYFSNYFSEATSETLSKLPERNLYISKVPNNSIDDQIDSDLCFNSSPEKGNSILSEQFQLSQEFVGRTKTFEELFKFIPKRFAIGSFMDIVSLQIDGQEIKVHPPGNTPDFSMSAYYAYGSCPYLLVYNLKKKYWLERGTLLYGKKNKLLQGDEIHKLGDGVSKIKIEERDKEITYIKYLSIIYTDITTNITQEVIPSLTKIAYQYEDYFLLRQGEFIEIDLQAFIPKNALDVKLKINGYYEILD